MGWGAALLEFTEIPEIGRLTWDARNASSLTQPFRRVWLLQDGGGMCDPTSIGSCQAENLHVLLLLIFLSMAIVVTVCAMTFVRDDKEEQITPLCPQLLVKDDFVSFQLPLDVCSEDSIDVTDLEGGLICKVAMDWPDPDRPRFSGVAATARLQNEMNLTLATVVARNVAVVGQSLALCRAGCEIFGFVEPVESGPDSGCFVVRHRSTVQLLTVTGDIEAGDMEIVNAVGVRVCTMKRVGAYGVGRVMQHVDAGLVLCSLLAAQVHRHLKLRVPVSTWDTIAYPPETSPRADATPSTDLTLAENAKEGQIQASPAPIEPQQQQHGSYSSESGGDNGDDEQEIGRHKDCGTPCLPPGASVMDTTRP